MLYYAHYHSKKDESYFLFKSKYNKELQMFVFFMNVHLLRNCLLDGFKRRIELLTNKLNKYIKHCTVSCNLCITELSESKIFHNF